MVSLQFSQLFLSAGIFEESVHPNNRSIWLDQCTSVNAVKTTCKSLSHHPCCIEIICLTDRIPYKCSDFGLVAMFYALYKLKLNIYIPFGISEAPRFSLLRQSLSYESFQSFDTISDPISTQWPILKKPRKVIESHN